MIVAVIALVVAIGGGSAVAAALITGRQIQDRSITGIDIARNTLTGVEINEARLGKVSAAVRADLLGNVPSSGYLRSTRIESGTVDITAASGSTPLPVFTDARLGLRVSYQNPARLLLENLNPAAGIHVSGVGFFGTTIFSKNFDIAAASSQPVVFDAVGFVYGSFIVSKQVTPVTATPTLQLMCTLDTLGARQAFTCQGVG